mgnify:CR=1 FL=1
MFRIFQAVSADDSLAVRTGFPAVSRNFIAPDVQIRRREDDVEIFRMYLRQQILVVKQKEKEVEVAREHLNEAMKERKTFEKLKEKAFEKFVAEENQKEVDELVSYRYGAEKFE